MPKMAKMSNTVSAEQKERQPAFSPDVEQFIQQEASEYIPRNIQEMKDIEILGAAWRKRLPVLIEGITGVGKTAMVRYFCYSEKIPYFRVNLNGGSRPEDLLGQFIPCEGGGFRWVDGVMTRFIRGGGCLVVDEINAINPEVGFVFHSLLDDERKIVLVQKDGEVVRAHPDFWLVATMNPAYYAGVRQMNEALRDRFGLYLKVDASLTVERKLIKDGRILALAKLFRKAAKNGQIDYLGTRQLLQLQENIAIFGVKVAVTSFLNRFEEIEAAAGKMLAQIVELFEDPDITEAEKKIESLIKG